MLYRTRRLTPCSLQIRKGIFLFGPMGCQWVDNIMMHHDESTTEETYTPDGYRRNTNIKWNNGKERRLGEVLTPAAKQSEFLFFFHICIF